MLTLQIFVDGTWRDAATLTFQGANKGDLRACRVEYLNDYKLIARQLSDYIQPERLLAETERKLKNWGLL